jgi:hypothetical protein
MPNSVAIANVEIQLQDGLQSGIPPVIFRTVPPVSYPSNFQVAYNGYTQVNAGGAFTVIGGGLDFPFVYLRNAGSRGIILATTTFEATPGSPVVIPLIVGGVFGYFNSSLNSTVKNYIQSLSIAPADQNPITCEWLIAQ